MEKPLAYIVEHAEDGMKMVDFLCQKKGLSGRFCKRATKEKRIRVNGEMADLGTRLKTDDRVEIGLNQNKDQDYEIEAMELEIIYEDDDIIVVNKPPYMLVHPTANYKKGTLTNGLLHHFRNKGEKCIVRLVSRLDRDTSGLVLIAKNEYAHMQLAKQMEKNEIQKFYLAVIKGVMTPLAGTIDLTIGKDLENNGKRIVTQDGQRSITHYTTKKTMSNSSSSIVELLLETGRTHQIRVHLSHLGHPIFGDTLYGGVMLNDLHRQALHAYRLEFYHPRTAKVLSLECNMPEDINRLVKELDYE